MRLRVLTAVILLAVAAAATVHGAELKLDNYFTDNMVIQRGKPITVTGTADKGATVTVTFAGQKKTGKADGNGRWAVTLDPVPANAKGQKLTASSSAISHRPLAISNVLVGDVFLHARQSYVDISLESTAEGKAAASKFKPSKTLRAITIKTLPTKTVQDDLADGATTGWTEIDRKNALQMSASAFYLGQSLCDELDVPVGIVDLKMGPHFGIGWLSAKALADSAIMHPNDKEISWLPGWMQEQAEERDSGKAQKALDEYYAAQVANNEKRGWGKPEKPLLGMHPVKNPMYPSAGYNAVINPLKSVAFKAVLLQLGNDYPFVAYREIEKQGLLTTKPGYDRGWHDNYVILKNGYRVTPVTLPYVVGDWRAAFGADDLPIGLILPPGSDLDVYAAHNREIRELHRRTSEKEDGIGLIMPGTENVPSSGQPVDDKLLADRASTWVLGAVAGKEGVTATGPLFERAETRLMTATIYFKEGTADGLKAQGNALDYFEAAGPDRLFTPAKAKIDGTTIKLESDGPVTFVRYDWSEKPDQGLVNSAGLPALPFNTDADWTFGWIPPPEQPNLPEEYTTTADKWSKNNVAIISGQIANLSQGDSAPIPIKPGPMGFSGAPFGPNIYVTGTDAGTPAHGKLLRGDVIYGVNGKIFDDSPGVEKDAQYFVLADAITYSESDEGQGKMVLSIRRGTKLMDIELQLQVLGSYSSTTPYYCEKSENIVKNAEAWSARQYRPESGAASEPTGMLDTDLYFLLASGTPEHQGLVRRAIYNKIAKMTPGPVDDTTVSKPWHTGYMSMLLGEYFHSTGDRNVLPYLEWQGLLSAASQLKPADETPATKEAAQSDAQVGGWRQNYPGSPDRWKSGYGLMPHAGMACAMGMQFAREAGLKYDEIALKRALQHFRKGRAEYGSVIYCYSGCLRDGPPVINPEAEANGKLWSMNGKLGTAAALYGLVDDLGPKNICARFCVYGYNNTRHGHGGMFFNNFWTPVGAWAGGESGYKHFMKGQRWWRELFRRYDGAFTQAGRGGVGVSYGLAYVAYKQRLRMLGAPRSAFGTNCPEYLKPAVAAHAERDYATCEKLVMEQMDGIIPAEDMPVVNHLLDSVQTLRASIAHDLDYTERMIKEGKFYYASLELPQLKGVVAASNPRLQAIEKVLASPDTTKSIADERRGMDAEARRRSDEARKAEQAVKKEEWISLIPQRGGKEEAGKWRVKIVEHIDHAPKTWVEPGFDDSAWDEATVPISWTMYHTALFRGKFNIDDKSAVDGLRVMGNFFQQANVVVYLNGKLVAKVDQLDRGIGTSEARLTDYAMKLLKKGENIIAISSRHKRRWGPYRGTYKTAETVSFWVEAKKAR